MLKSLKGYLYNGQAVILNKDDIPGLKEEDLVEIEVLINEDIILDIAFDIQCGRCFK